ncbi:MAG: type 1 periplasmic-binding domain-containing protein [Acidimicrobiales bacterium]
MSAFQEFRLWARRAPVGERVSVALAAVVAVTLLGWLLVPAATKTGASSSAFAVSAGSSGVTVKGGESAAGGSAATVAGGPTAGGGTSIGGAAGQTTAGQAAAVGPAGSVAGSGGGVIGAGGCSSPPGGDQGVTASEIKVAITLVNIIGPAGNSTFGVPSTSEQQADFQWSIDAINAAGGVACRKLVPHFYTANPVDQSDLHQKCLDIAQAKPFAVIESGGYTGSPSVTCFPQNQLPLIGGGLISGSERDQYYPYMFGGGRWETLYRNAALALQARGFFSASNGFKKLGLIYRSCLPEVNAAYVTALNEAGVPSSEIVTYNAGCPSGFVSASDMEQAVLKFEQNAVTNMTENLFYTDFANFTTIAQQQGFKPKYGIADDGIVAITNGNLHPDYSNIANAIAISSNRFAEEQTPGLSPTGGTARCDAIFKAHNKAPVWRQPVGFGGLACDLVWTAVAAIGHAPALQRNALAAGLQAAKTIDFSFPSGPADFSGPKVTYGGQFWRPLQFVPSCTCWRVIDSTFRPSL